MRGKFFICLMIILSLLFSSCVSGENVSADKLMGALVEYFGAELHACRYIYYKSASEYSRNYLSHSLAGVIYYGERRDHVWELDIMSDYAVRLADDESGCEIHIFKVRARSDTDTVEKILRRRVDYLQKRMVYIYTPENYEKYISSAQVHLIGNYAVLLATPDNSSALKILKGMIGA